MGERDQDFFERRRRQLECVVLGVFGGTLLACVPGPIETAEGADSEMPTETGTDEGIEPPPPPDPDICFAEFDAAGSGDCGEVVGWRWAFGGCEAVVGCECVGTECDQLLDDRTTCDEAYLHCRLCDLCPEDMLCVSYCSGAGYLSDLFCLDGHVCADGYYTDYGCPYEDDNGQSVGADMTCSGLGRGLFTGPMVGAPRELDSDEQLAAAAWARIAAAELASVEVFESLAGWLEAHACPPSLVADARRFAEDEVRHARVAWGLARARDPEVVWPRAATIPVSGLPSLAELIEHTVLSGCIGETLSALELEHMAAICDEPELAATLREIVEDESRHAEHAWALLTYLLRARPELVVVARAAFEQHTQTVPLGLEQALEGHGLLDDETRATLWDQGRHRVVAPLASLVLDRIYC